MLVDGKEFEDWEYEMKGEGNDRKKKEREEVMIISRVQEVTRYYGNQSILISSYSASSSSLHPS